MPVVSRVTPGNLTFIDNKSMFDIYSEFKAVYYYVRQPMFYSGMTIDFIVLIFCSAYNGFNLDQRCYDNVFADINLENGTPQNVYGYVDLYTWRGWFKVFGFALVYFFAKNMIQNTYRALFDFGVLVLLPNTQICASSNSFWDCTLELLTSLQ